MSLSLRESHLCGQRIGNTPGATKNYLLQPTFITASPATHYKIRSSQLISRQVHVCANMAKSARASVVKKNGRNLRAKVFGPVDEARTARLSAKLQELAAKPRPETEKPMDLDEKAPADEEDKDENVDGTYQAYSNIHQF
jgi:hypothetical protein